MYLSKKRENYQSYQGFDMENLTVDPYVKKLIERDGWKQKNMFAGAEKN